MRLLELLAKNLLGTKYYNGVSKTEDVQCMQQLRKGEVEWLHEKDFLAPFHLHLIKEIVLAALLATISLSQQIQQILDL